jgi:protein kinase-like protein
MAVAVTSVGHGAADTTQTACDSVESRPSGTMPAQVGRYELCEQLGAGAMGVVYRARDPRLDRAIAIKLVRHGGATSAGSVRLLREAQAMARLHHPNVVPIFDVGPAGGAVFLAMPLLEGGTLRSWLGDRPRSVDAILDRFVAAGRGLAAAHGAGLVHRDFKPENVLLDIDGEVHVGDFGLARLAVDEPGPVEPADELAADELTRTGAVVGTPPYMAPEQLRGLPIDARADQFSFCVALWEAIHGERPFPSPKRGVEQPLLARLAAIASGPVIPPARSGRPAWIAELLARGLAADPDRRWPSMQALLDAIAAHRTARRWPRRLAMGAGALGLVSMIAAFARPVPAPVSLPAVPLVHDGGLRAAAISPDGSLLAVVTGDSLVIRGSEVGARERVVVEHGVDGPIAWAPDNRHLLVGTVSELASVIQTELVDIEAGVQGKLPATGFAAFLSDTEVVVTSYRQRSVAIVPLDARAGTGTTCAVPGAYRFLMDVAGRPDGTIVVETEALDSERHGLVILGRDCAERGRFEQESLAGFALSDRGTIVALVPHDDLDEILEISLQGEVVSRRRVSGVLGALLGRRHGTDYVTTLAPKTELVRVHARDGVSQQQQLYATDGNAAFRLAPDGETVAWVERDGRDQHPGLLWLSTLQHMTRSQVLLRNAWSADWSPDGRSLAVLVEDGAGGAKGARRSTTSLVILDRDGRERWRTRTDHLYRASAPVWLDSHRIAVRTDHRSTYREIDLATGDERELFDTEHGATCLLVRSPRDGTLAMWRNGPPGAIDARTDHLWLQRPGHAVGTLRVEDAIRNFLAPSWSPSGELLVRALDGAVSRVALDTGERVQIAQLPPQQLSYRYDDHVMALDGGDLLAVNHELGANVARIDPGSEPQP